MAVHSPMIVLLIQFSMAGSPLCRPRYVNLLLST